VTITAGINVGAAMYLIGAATRILNIPADVHVPFFGKLDSWGFQLTVMVVLMIPQVLINIYGIRLTARLNDFSVWWHIGGVFLIVGLLLFLAHHRNSLSFLLSSVTTVNPLDAASAEINGKSVPALVFGDKKLSSPLFAMIPGLAELYKHPPFLFVFVLGMLQAQWTYTGYDASAHVAEETVMARLNTAWGVFLSVAVSAVVGYLLIMALTWCIPKGDIAATANDPYPVLYIAYNNLPVALGHLVAIIIGGAMWLCGCSSITSMARMWYAFARDDGMPGAKYIKQIDPKKRTPIYSILITSVLAVAICIYAAAYYVVTSISVITLYLAYVIPIYLNWRNRRRKQGEWVRAETAPWNLGRWSPVINFISIIWTLLICVVFSIPPNELVLWTMVILAIGLAFYWFAFAARTFRPVKAP
jgi:amino acid transporter